MNYMDYLRVSKIEIFKILYKNDLPKILTAIVSEGMLSVSNFAIGILMAKYAAKTEYAMYVIMFSIIGFFGAYQNAIINGPLMVLINHKNEKEKKRYISSLAVGKNYIFIPSLFLLATTGVLYSAITNSRFYIMEILILIIVVMIYLSKEFIRTLNFVIMDTYAILKMDLFNVIIVLIGMSLLVYCDIVSNLTAIVVLGAGYLAAYFFAKRKSPYPSSQNNKSIKESLKENWNYGKWALLGTTCSLAQDRGYIYIVSILLGLATLADISAARLFLMPIGLLNLSCAKIVISKGSKNLSLNKNNEFRKFVFYFISILLIIWLFYFLFIVLTSNLIIGFLGEKYINTKDLILLWGVFFFVYTIRFQLCTALAVYKQFKELAKIDILVSTLTITSCFLLAFTIGRSGALLALILGEFVAMILYLKLYFRSLLSQR